MILLEYFLGLLYKLTHILYLIHSENLKMSDLPYKTEYAKSNRSACRKCKVKIDKEELRIAAMIQVNKDP